MKYTTTLNVYTNSEKVYKCFLAELEKSKKERSEFVMKQHSDHVEFVITAQDATALRATFNYLTRLLTVFEKTASI